jgi:hypothetical protein
MAFKDFEKLSNAPRVGNPDKPLNEKEHAFVQHRATGLNKTASARLAGFSQPSKDGALVEQRPHVATALAREQALYLQASSVKRKDVIDGIVEAIERAKLKGEPMTEIAGWREIAKICGHYAPEVKKVQLSVSAQKLQSQYEEMSDEDLLELASADGATRLIEGECALVKD